ncbi:hypothetical protein NQ176_g8656 [Zarea fungicola]|uniref:Uncharacterized protein n=1 Tax=Zarea fungicola TaxID=93591 RepID=A0ACC1MRK6_9HYPO|nr:hypothetical protein NQ176_g8656 [Lecanicillium fungicola]
MIVTMTRSLSISIPIPIPISTGISRSISAIPLSLGLAPKADLRLAVWHSVGLRISETGTVVDVRRYSAADKAGLAPTQQIKHVGGKRYSLEEMTAQLAATLGGEEGGSSSSSSAGGGETKVIKLSLTQDEDSWETEIEHTIGLVYPALQRQTGEEARRDLLADIFAPRG